MSKPTPLLTISDAPTSPSGLARIHRELAVRIYKDMPDVFRLGVAGYGGTYSPELPFEQYQLAMASDWTTPQLPNIWKEFAGGQDLVCLFIWNSSWLPWVSDPSNLPFDLKKMFMSDKVKKWVYTPIDAEGPTGKLLESQGAILRGFDRVLAYTEWAAKLMQNAMYPGGAELGIGSIPNLPHGTDETVFYPRDRSEARRIFLQKILNNPGRLDEATTLLSIIATNSTRKDWGLGFEVCGELLKRGINIGLWAHTNRIRNDQAWDLQMLADEFGMKQRTIFTTGHLTDDNLAWGMAAADCFLGVGSGEGWGLVHSSSLAMGIPCLTGDYAGAAEFTPQNMKIKPAGFHLDGCDGNRRPVFHASDWADKVLEVVRPFDEPRICLLDPKYFWTNCWPQWKKWLKEGVE